MSSFDNTMELERALLRILVDSQIMIRLNFHLVKDYFFTSKERRFIFATIADTYSSSGAIVTRKLIEYEIGSRIADNEQVFYVSEWNLIEGLVVTELPEILVQKLEDANVGRQLSELGEQIDTLLEGGRISEALGLMKQKTVTLSSRRHTDRPISEITVISKRDAVLEDKKLNPLKYRGLQTGFKMFDDCTGGLFPGELTLVAGITGTGKSTFVRQLQANVVRLHPDKNVLHIANEEYLEQVEHKFDANIAEVPYLDFKRGTISEDDRKKWRDTMANWQRGRLFIKEVPAFTDVSLVEHAYRELEAKGIPIHLITIDHLPHIKPIQKYFDQNDERAKAAADCKEIARCLRVPVLIPTQAATVVEEKQKKLHRGDKLDVYGSKAQVHVANTFILITATGTFDDQMGLKEWERDVRWLADVKKNRDGPVFYFELRHRVQYGIVEEISGSGAKGIPKSDPIPATPKETAPEKGESRLAVDNILSEENEDDDYDEEVSEEEAVKEEVKVEKREEVKEEVKEEVFPGSMLSRLRNVGKKTT